MNHMELTKYELETKRDELLAQLEQCDADDDARIWQIADELDRVEDELESLSTPDED